MAPKDKEVAKLTAESGAAGKKDAKGGAKKKADGSLEPVLDTMSEEDKELKERLETCVSTLTNENKEASVTVPIRLKALDVIVSELRTSTSSMTSVPKPLKFLRPHFAVLKALYAEFDARDGALEIEGLELRARLADVLAVLAMTMGKPEERESLRFKLKGAKDHEAMVARGVESKYDDNLGSWGHEFVRSLAGEIGQEYAARVVDGADPEDDGPFQDLLKMADVIVPFHLTHNAEAEAVDLLIEVQRLKKLLELDAVDENNYGRICLYLTKTADYMSDPDDLEVSPKRRASKTIVLDKSLTHNISLCDRKCWKRLMISIANRTSSLTHFASLYEWIGWKTLQGFSKIARIPWFANKCVCCWAGIVSTTKSMKARLKQRTPHF